MYRALACFLCLLLSSLSCPVFAQNSILQFHAIQIPGAFPAAGIKMAKQDKAGLLWYSTNDGLYRYDGSEVLHFGLQTSPALPYLPLYCIQPDERGNLWLGFAGGAAKFDLKSWTITPLYTDDWYHLTSNDKTINIIACVPDGNVYFGTSSGKLYVVKHDSLRQVADLSQGITRIAEPIKGQLWLSTGIGSLVSINVRNGIYGVPHHYKFAEARGKGICNVCYDSSGKFLFSVNETGLFLGDIHQLNANRDMASLSSYGASVRGLVTPVASPEGNPDVLYSPLYIGSGRVAVMTGRREQPRDIYMFNFKTATWKPATPSFPVKFPGLISYVSSYPGGALVSSTEGLTRVWFQKTPITSLLSSRVSKNSIRSIYKEGGMLYIGSYRDGFVRYNEHSGKISHLANASIYSILPWDKDKLLLADEGRGLFWYSLHTNKLTAIPLKNLSDPQLPRMATVLCKVNDSLVLEGSYHGVKLVDPVKGIIYPVLRGPLSKTLQSLQTDAVMPLAKANGPGLGKYLIATTRGVFVADLDKGHVQYLLQDSVPEKTRQAIVFSLLRVGTQIWMGSGGLGILTTDTSGRQLSMEWLNARLTGHMVYSLAQCGNDVLIGTNKGLNVLHLKDSSISYYTTYNGLPAEEFNQAAVFNHGKEAYLGTANGIIRWTYGGPDIQDKHLSPRIHINKLTVVDKDHSRTVSYNLPYLPEDSQRIVIPVNAGYFSLTFGKPYRETNSLDYYYRLNSGQDWIRLGNTREATFIKTSPGHYHLQFATKTPGEKLTPDKWAISLIVKPAFWQTVWFKILVVLVFATILLLVFRYREKQRSKERSLRMKIAGDLHDEVGSALSTIWHQVRHVLQRTTQEMKGISKPLQTIADISGEALSVMNDIVWSIDARFDTMDEFFLRMKDYVYKLQNELDIPVKLEVTGRYQNRKLSQIIRQNLFLLFKEAVNNAMKHGDGNTIIIIMHFDNKLEMQVQNTCSAGNGKNHEAIQGGRGLQIMRQRAARMNGDLHTEQKENKFIVTVTV